MGSADSALVKEEDLPVWSQGPEPEGLAVMVDGLEARCLIAERAFASAKIVVLFAEPSDRWGPVFQTKYFEFIEPGRMKWGHDGEVMEIVRAVE